MDQYSHVCLTIFYATVFSKKILLFNLFFSSLQNLPTLISIFWTLLHGIIILTEYSFGGIWLWFLFMKKFNIVETLSLRSSFLPIVSTVHRYNRCMCPESFTVKKISFNQKKITANLKRLGYFSKRLQDFFKFFEFMVPRTQKEIRRRDTVFIRSEIFYNKKQLQKLSLCFTSSQKNIVHRL